MRLLLLTIISTGCKAQNQQSDKSAAAGWRKAEQGVSLEFKSELRGIGNISGNTALG
jgi:hypothetical protein